MSLVPPGSAAKQAFRKQQLRTWKLQQQREVEEKRREVEEERRRREEEIRKIRDLSNQDEQYNRFMKLVGGKRQTRSKVRPYIHSYSCRFYPKQVHQIIKDQVLDFFWGLRKCTVLSG